MRTSGAQRWVAAGVDLEVTKLFGRWEDARQMMKYIREAALSDKCLDKSAKATGRGTSSAAINTSHIKVSRKWSRLVPSS